MTRGAIAVLGAGVLILVGCTGSPDPDRIVTGRFVRVGGPAPGAPFSLPGTITARAVTGRAFTATAGRDGHFTLWLPPGRYQVTGRSPLIDGGYATCPATRELRVTRGKPAKPVTVVCSIK